MTQTDSPFLFFSPLSLFFLVPRVENSTKKPRYNTRFYSGMPRAYGIEKFHKNEPVWFSNYLRRREESERFVQSVKYRRSKTIFSKDGNHRGRYVYLGTRITRQRENGISLAKKERPRELATNQPVLFSSARKPRFARSLLIFFFFFYRFHASCFNPSLCLVRDT